MSSLPGIIPLILANSPITDIIGTRLYSDFIPENETLPAILIEEISETRPLPHSGSTGIVKQRVRLNTYGDTLSAAKSVSDKIRVLLHGYQGTSAGIPLQRVWFANAFSVREHEARVSRVVQDFLVTFSE